MLALYASNVLHDHFLLYNSLTALKIQEGIWRLRICAHNSLVSWNILVHIELELLQCVRGRSVYHIVLIKIAQLVCVIMGGGLKLCVDSKCGYVYLSMKYSQGFYPILYRS